VDRWQNILVCLLLAVQGSQQQTAHRARASRASILYNQRARDRVRSALCFLIEAQPGIQLVGAFGPGPDLVVRLLALRPDVVLLDWGLPDHLAEQVLLVARRALSPPRVVVLSVRPDDETQARAAGAAAFVSKSQPPVLLIQSLYS
jgi:DNA-binding NarL/FixJ family response regulator